MAKLDELIEHLQKVKKRGSGVITINKLEMARKCEEAYTELLIQDAGEEKVFRKRETYAKIRKLREVLK